SRARATNGCDSGRLLANLYENSACCARATCGAPMLPKIPPETADAAEALSSVRREKLIWFSLEASCCCGTQSYTDPMGSGHPRTRCRPGVLRRRPAPAISAFRREAAWPCMALHGLNRHDVVAAGWIAVRLDAGSNQAGS